MPIVRSWRAALYAVLGFLACLLVFYRTPWSGQLISRSASSLQHSVLNDIGNSTLGFQKIFAINLPSRTDRRDSLSLAAAYTGLDINYIAATGPDDVYAHVNDTRNPGTARAWRSHANVLRMIVEENVSSALILEDDIDWDIRIKDQMRHFAAASRTLIQPLKGHSDRFLDPSIPKPKEDEGAAEFNVLDDRVTTPSTSPYGDLDRWDLLWPGHCGSRFPRAEDGNIPLARVVIPNDITVPKRHHLNMEFGDEELINSYPEHTRIVSRARANSCSLAYAVSQRGARRMLYELSLNRPDSPGDVTLRLACDGEGDLDPAVCLTVQPQLFQHHRPRGSRAAFSDVDDYGDDFNEVAGSANIRWSTMLNFDRLVKGETNFIDQFPDTDSATGA